MIESLASLWDYLQIDLFPLPSRTEQNPLFNLYSCVEPSVDRVDADQIRRENLGFYLSSFPRCPEVLVVGEAPGWRGCRFSGVPFTSEAQAAGGKLPFWGERSSKQFTPHSEASASIFWSTMRPYFPQFLTWNCLPLHPHKPGLPQSNRHATQNEASRFDHILCSIIHILQPNIILAVGRLAQDNLTSLGFDCISIRHPSHGGAAAFKSGIQASFNKMGNHPL